MVKALNKISITAATQSPRAASLAALLFLLSHPMAPSPTHGHPPRFHVKIAAIFSKVALLISLSLPRSPSLSLPFAHAPRPLRSPAAQPHSPPLPGARAPRERSIRSGRRRICVTRHTHEKKPTLLLSSCKRGVLMPPGACACLGVRWGLGAVFSEQVLQRVMQEEVERAAGRPFSEVDLPTLAYALNDFFTVYPRSCPTAGPGNGLKEGGRRPPQQTRNPAHVCGRATAVGCVHS